MVGQGVILQGKYGWAFTVGFFFLSDGVLAFRGSFSSYISTGWHWRTFNSQRLARTQLLFMRPIPLPDLLFCSWYQAVTYSIK